MTLLAGDIGGTKTLLCVADEAGQILAQQNYSSASYVDLESMIREFFAGPAADFTVRAACLAVAGPVQTFEGGLQCARITNLPWEIGTAGLKSVLPHARMRLVNDFFAVGHGVAALTESDLATLQDQPPVERAPRLIVGAGTGLGVAQLAWTQEGYQVLPSEGGHMHFSPTDEVQDGLLRWGRTLYGRVSIERFVSGPGLAHIYAYLSQASGKPVPEVLADAGTPARVTAGARAGDALSRSALDLFVRIYGAVVGDMALLSLPYGGVYLAGGIAGKILPELNQNSFLQAFTDKGRMRPIVAAMPVHVVLNPLVGLLGAVRLASRL